MKLKMNCPKCKSIEIDVIAEEGNHLPMYKCRNCGHKGNLFPQFGKKDEGEE